jgi:carbohydrate diacid regulator
LYTEHNRGGEEVFVMINPEVAQEIADKTTEIIGYNILVTDDAGIVIGSGDVDRVGTFHEASLETVQRGVMTSHDIAAAEQLEGVKPGVTLPVVLENRTVGTVGITGNPREVEPFGMVVKSQTEIMLRESLHLRIALLQERALESLVYDIANYDPAILEPEALVARGEELGYDLNLTRVSVVVDLAQFTHLATSYRLSSDNRTPELELQSLKLGVLRTIKDVFGDEQDLATSIGTGKFGVLHSLWPNEEDKDLMSRTTARCRHLTESIQARHDIVANVGIGTVANSVPELKDSYQDAWNALHLGKRLARHRQVFHIGEFRVQELLLTVSYSSRKRFLQALLHPLKGQADWETLRSTIMAWCESGYNLVEASKALYIHRNTLIYRLNKIQELTGKSPRDYEHAFALYLACLLDRLDA